MNPEARCRADRPGPGGSKARNRLGEPLARPAFFVTLTQEGDMRDRLPARLSHGRVVSRLIPVLALGALLPACRDGGRSLAPKTDGLQFGLSATAGLTGRIAFHSNRDGDFDIYVMNADGSGVTQVTHNTINEFDPIWSPNGQQIAFGRISGCCAAAVVVINADGSGERVLADNGFPGAWSPDGRRFVFSSTRDGGDIDIFVMNADGTGVTQLTHNDFIADDDPVWSPDGKQIAFHSTRDGGDEDIFVMNADGTGVIQLTNNSVLPDGSPIFDAVPSWTAGAREVATGGRCLPPPAGLRGWWPGDGDVGDLIGGNHGIGTFNVYVMTKGGSNQTQLTDVPGYNARPNWSHDGRRITFTTCRPTDFSCEIYVMNAAGSGQTKLTST